MRWNWKTLLSIVVGNALLAIGICAFAVPNNIMLGGTTGIALAIQHFVPVRLSVITAVVNIILFLLGLIFLGKSFAAASLLSTFLYPLIIGLFEELPLASFFNEELVISAVTCAVLFGLGIGMVVRTGGSTGGMDIPPCILQKYRGIPVGTSLMVFDSLIVVAQMLCNGNTNGVLMSLLVITITSITINRTLVSGESKVEIIIISPEYERIRQEILKGMDSGLTMLKVETGYKGSEQMAIYSVVYAKKYPAIRDAALSIDKKAFIVAADVRNVNGRGYTLSRTGEVN